MSWLTETLNKIAKSYEGLNTSAMQGAGSMGLLNIERATEKMNPEEAKEFKLKAKANLVTGTMLAPAVPFLVNGLVTAPVTTALELAGGTAAGIGATLVTDKAIEAGSNGKYTGFTDYVTKKFPDSNPYIVEQFHPAGWIGGLLGGWGTRNAFIRTPRGRIELVNSELAKNISNTKLDLELAVQPKTKVRTKIGDVEIDDPNLNYRLVSDKIAEQFYKTGKQVPTLEESGYILDGTIRPGSKIRLGKVPFSDPMYNQGSLFYGIPNKNSYHKGLLVTKEPLAYSSSSGKRIIPDTPIVDGYKTYIYDPYSRSKVGGRRVPYEGLILDYTNTESYIFDPNYGYRKIIIPSNKKTYLKLLEKPSKLTEAEKLGIPKGERNSYLIGSNADPSYYSALGLNNNK